MALEGIQSINTSSIGSLLFSALASTGAFGVSQTTQDRLTSLQNTESATAARLTDLAELRELLFEFSSAAAGLRPAPTSTLSLSTIGVDKNNETVELTLTTDAQALQDGDKIIFDSAIDNVAANTPYFLKVQSTDANSVNIRLYTSRTDAINNANNYLLITNNVTSTITAKGYAPEPEAAVEALFTAYNDLQEFLTEKTSQGGSLADVSSLASIGSKLLEAIRPVLENDKFAGAVSIDGPSRQLTIDSTALADRVADYAPSIAALFDPTGTDLSNELRLAADSAINTVDTLVHTFSQRSPELTGQINELLSQSLKEQSTGFATIGKITGAISLTQLRIGFLSAL